MEKVHQIYCMVDGNRPMSRHTITKFQNTGHKEKATGTSRLKKNHGQNQNIYEPRGIRLLDRNTREKKKLLSEGK